MPGNRAIYDRAMDQSREAARLKRWDEALKNAARALQEFPQDTDARASVAVFLFQTGQLARALQLLNELHKADPDNPFYLDYIARAQEGQGAIDQAIASYQMLVEIHQNQRANAKTIQVVREMLRLRPALDEQREFLAHLLQENRAYQEAAAEYLKLARSYQEQGLLDDAAERAELAARLDPNSRAAKDLIVALHDAMASAAGLSTPAVSEDAHADETQTHPRILTGNLRSEQFTLEKLIASAIERQEAGDTEGAIADYEEVLSRGMNRADVCYSLGLLYQERASYQDAVRVLTQAAKDPEYALSAHFALGSSYTSLKQLPQAAQEYEQAIALVDLNTVGKTEAEDLIQMYEQVTEIYQQLGDLARSASLYSTLASFLKTKRWGKERADEFAKRAKELTDRNMFAKLRSLGTGALTPQEPQPEPEPTPPEEQLGKSWGKITPIIDFLRPDAGDVKTVPGSIPLEALPQSDPLDMLDTLPAAETPTAPVTPLDTTGLEEQTERWVVASERYIEQGLLDAAMDACFEVMLRDPDYIPIHLRMGEIFERQHLTEEALVKYQTLIDTYSIRNEPIRAIDVYYRLIDLSPDTINSRARLADLLNQVGRTDDAAEQLAQVASSYARLGQTNRALEEFRKALQWAPRNKEIRALYGMALFRLERYEAALSEFHKAADANDSIAIAHINMTLAMIGEQPGAIWDSLAALLDLIKERKNDTNTVQAEYRTALIGLDDPLLRYMLGIIQQESNQHASALLEFEQAADALTSSGHPILDEVLVHQAMASSYIAMEQAEQALQALRQAQSTARSAPADATIKHDFAKPLSKGELVWQMAEAYAATEDLERAEQALRDAIKLLPYNQTIYTKLADVCFRQGKLAEALSSLEDLAIYHENHQHLDRAIETLEYASKLAPGNIAIGGRLARLYIRRGYPDRGVEGLLRVAELQRKEGQIKDAVANLQQAGEIRWMQNQHQETLAIYDRIVAIAPQDVEARQWRAIMYTLVSRTDEAIAEKKQIANILAQRKDYDNAIAELHQIIGLNTNDTDAYYMLGDMLMRRGEYTQALNLYNRMARMPGFETERVEALIAAANQMVKSHNQQIPS